MIEDYRDKFNQCAENLKKLGDLYATAKSDSWYKQECKHSVLASVMNGLEGPISQRENQARASEDYLKHLLETRDAIQKELKLKSQYERQKYIFEGLRSICSLEKHASEYEKE